jgi:hypothetical protein
MKIDSSCVRLDAQHEFSRTEHTEVERRLDFASALQAARTSLAGARGQGTGQSEPNAPAVGRAGPCDGRDAAEMARRVRQMIDELVSSLLALFAGQNCRQGGKEAGRCGTALPDLADPAALATDGSGAPRTLATMTWSETTVRRVEEREATTFEGCGTVRCADGREIAFDLRLAMNRDFRQTELSREDGTVVLRDPLAINFDGKAAELTGTKVAFDLDADGHAELVPELAAGCGWLCFDADQDGKIADGRELFGATGQNAGDGFADLARHDADGNGWIDDADPAFAAIGVWFPDGRLESLKTAGIGALHVGSVASPFALKDEDNALRGQVTRSGVWLREDGTAGTLQQVDVGVAEPPAA